MYFAGIQPQQPDADGAHDLDRLRRRRCDRDDREHRALRRSGESPLQAALKGAEQIGFTIVSLTVSLIAVLIPLLFMSDVVGRLFREFAMTLSVTILVSAVVSLTLTPMMCARILRNTPRERRRAARAMRWRTGLRRLRDAYGRSLTWVTGPAGHDAGGVCRHVVVTALVVRRSCPKGSFRSRTPASSSA